MKSKKLRNSLALQLPKLTEVLSYAEYTLKGINNWEEVSSLGTLNLEELVKSARGFEKSLSHQIEANYQKINLLKGNSGKEFLEMAKSYENPQDMEIGRLEGNWMNEDEPIDAKSRNREYGTTTFNICGWCKHSGGGSCRYSYHITSSCSLIDNSPETKFNTSCLLHSKTYENIQKEIQLIEDEIEKIKIKRQKVRTGISHLLNLKRNSIIKPYIMSLRPHDFFNVGDEVMIYMGGWNENERLVKGDWVEGIVVFGYRHQDGCVSYQTNFPIHSNMSNLEGRGGGAGMTRPEVLMKKDFLALKNAFNSDRPFYDLWFKNIDSHLKGFDVETFKSKVVDGLIAVPAQDWVPPAYENFNSMTLEEAMSILCLLCEPKKGDEKFIDSWAKMQLSYVHPDKVSSEKKLAVHIYAERQTKKVLAARDFLIERIKNLK